MEKDKMMRIVIADAVRKGIRNIKTDPYRSIRNLVDLGNHFSPDGFSRRSLKIRKSFSWILRARITT
jgi:hypothetical protein